MNQAELSKRAGEISLLALDVDGVLTDGRIYFDRYGNEMRSFNYLDIMGISRLKLSGVRVVLISGEKDEILDKYAEKLKIEKTVQGCKEKDKALADIARYYEVPLSQVCFIGDDVNDIPALKRAGLSVTVPNSAEKVKTCVDYVTNAGGGFGAVREICDMIMAEQ